MKTAEEFLESEEVEDMALKMDKKGEWIYATCMMEKYAEYVKSNLHIVNCQREQLKDKQTPIFEDWVKDTYIKESDNTYIHKEYKFKKDGHQVRNIYNLLFQNL